MKRFSLDDGARWGTILDLVRCQGETRPNAPALIWLRNGRVDDEPVQITYAAFSTRVGLGLTRFRGHHDAFAKGVPDAQNPSPLYP